MAIVSPVLEDKQLGSEASARQVKNLVEVMKQNDISLEEENKDQVNKHGNEIIAGVKQFTSSPIVPTPINDADVANKKYVDDHTSGSADEYLIRIKTKYDYETVTYPTINLFDKSKVTQGAYYNDSAVLTMNAAYCTSEKIYLEPGKTYKKVGDTSDGNNRLFNSNGVLIKKWSANSDGSSPFTVPLDAGLTPFICMLFGAGTTYINTTMLVEAGVDTSVYIPYAAPTVKDVTIAKLDSFEEKYSTAINVLSNDVKTIVTLGDSSVGSKSSVIDTLLDKCNIKDTWCEVAADLLNVDVWKNFAKWNMDIRDGGSTTKSVVWNSFAAGSTNVLSNQVYMLLNHKINYSSFDPDVIIIHGGGNELPYSQYIGNYDTAIAFSLTTSDYSYNVDPTRYTELVTYRQTVYGALRWALETLTYQFPNAQIYLGGILPRNESTNSVIPDYITAYEKISSYCGVKFINTYQNVGMSKLTSSLLRYNDDSGIHQNSFGKRLIGTFVAKHLLTTYYEKPDIGTIMFYDDFTGSTIDTTKWALASQLLMGSMKTDTTWNSAYIDTVNKYLVLKASGNTTSGYKCGAVCTKDLFEFTHGRVDVRMRVATVAGSFPAIWLMNYQYPEETGSGAWGEIDIMETVNTNNNVYHTLHSKYTRNVSDTNPDSQVYENVDVTVFHKYSLEWTSEKIIWYIDDVKMHEYNNIHYADEATNPQWPFNKDYYLVLDYMLGGTWAGEPTTTIDAKMEIDYVKITKF